MSSCSECGSSSSLYPVLGQDETQAQKQGSRSHTPPPPFTPTPVPAGNVRTIPAGTYISQDAEKGSTGTGTSENRKSRRSFCGTIGWIFLGLVIGSAISEGRHYYNNSRRSGSGPYPLTDPDSVDLSKYFRGNA